MAKTKKPVAKPSKSTAKVAPKPSAPAKPMAAAKAARPKSVERLEIPAPDFQEWWDNLKAYAYKSPAALVVGVIAVWMALVLLFD